MMALHQRGLSDPEIAEQTGKTRSAVLRWHRRNNLAPVASAMIPTGVRMGARNDERFLPLYGRGWSDSEIAAATGVKQRIVARWRYARQLAPFHRPPPSQIAPEAEARRLELHGYGLSDEQVARRVGVSSASIFLWRRRRGLKPNRQSETSGALSPLQREKRLRLLKRGMTDREIAAQVGVTPKAIASWRAKYGLAVNPAPRDFLKVTGRMEEQRLHLYRAGRTDAEIAKSVGVRASSIAAWRDQRGLDANDGVEWERGPRSIVSLDAELGEGGFNLHGLVADDAAAAWLEEAGATTW